MYTYDPRNRLQLAAENSTSPSALACADTDNVGVSALQPTAFDGNNRISGSGWTYDPAGHGNITANPIGQTFAYDAENRQTSAKTGSSTTQYVCDGERRRVKRLDPTGTKTTSVVMS